MLHEHSLEVQQLREAGRSCLRQAQKLRALLAHGDVEDTPQTRRELDDLGARARAHFDKAAALENSLPPQSGQAAL